MFEFIDRMIDRAVGVGTVRRNRRYGVGQKREFVKKPPVLIFIAVALLLLLGQVADAAHLHTERWYQEFWCKPPNKIEYILPDRTRVDCLTEDLAVEVDFAVKWYEGYTQARWYAMHTGKKAGLLLIIEKESDWKYLYRAERMRDHYGDPIEIMIIGNDRQR